MKYIASRFIALVMMSFFAFSMAAHADNKSDKGFSNNDFKVLLEVNNSTPESWHNAINTARQVMTVVGMDNAQVEVVAWGPGIKMLLKNSPVADNIKSLSAYGIKFLACGNTMKSMHLKTSDLAEGVTEIPGAVAHIVKRNKEGWTQIKM